MIDFAYCMKWLVDVLYPDAISIRVVLDNLGTHKPASLYEAFPPEEAQRILKKLEFHFTPKHGNWLNMAWNALSIQVEAEEFTSRRNFSSKTFHCSIRATKKLRNSFRLPSKAMIYQSPCMLNRLYGHNSAFCVFLLAGIRNFWTKPGQLCTSVFVIQQESHKISIFRFICRIDKKIDIFRCNKQFWVFIHYPDAIIFYHHID